MNNNTAVHELKEGLKYFDWWKKLSNCSSIKDINNALSATDIYEILNISEVKDILINHNITYSPENVKYFYCNFLLKNIDSIFKKYEINLKLNNYEFIELNKNLLFLLEKTDLSSPQNPPTIFSEVDKMLENFMIKYFNYINNLR